MLVIRIMAIAAVATRRLDGVSRAFALAKR